MAGRARYTDEDKSAVYVALTVNDGNLKRTARETGLPENTIRRWRDDWRKGDVPPATEVEKATTGFLTRAETIRDAALSAIELKIADAKVSELTTLVGVLDDKITRGKGLADRKVEHVHTLPSADEVKEALSGFMLAAQEAAAQRQADVLDAELVSKPRALPAPR